MSLWSPDDRPHPLIRAGRARFLPGSTRGILLLLLIVALVPVLLVQAAIHYASFQERQAQEFEANLELARAVAATFDAYTDHILSEELAIGTAFTAPQPMPPGQAQRLLDESLRGYPSLRYYSWVDPGGRVLFSTLLDAVSLDLADRSYYQQIARGREWAVSNLIVGKLTSEPTFAVARGIRDGEGTLLGMVVATVDPGRLGDVLGVQRAGQSVIAIIDGEGRGVYRYPEAEMTWDQRNWIASPPTMPQALAGKEVTGTFVSPIDGKLRMSGLAPVSSIGWVAGASRPMDEVLAPVIRGLVSNFALLLVVSGLAAAAAIAIGRYMTVPIARLRDHALAVGRGEMAQPVTMRGPDELVDLAQTFDRMAGEIAVREDQRERLLAHLREINVRLVSTLREQRELFERHEDLLRALSHDLRTPLTAIQGHAQMLQRLVEKANLDERIQRSAQAVVAGARQMNNMIQDLVDSARMESGQLTLNSTAISLRSFILELEAQLAAAIETSRIQLAVPESLPEVSADPARLERIMTNLLSNALKYSPSETTVVIHAVEMGAKVEVSVTDQGIGISPNDLPYLFDRYYRATGARKTEGLGLGLFVTKMLVEAHEGRLWAESEVGRGTSFHFTLPVAYARAA